MDLKEIKVQDCRLDSSGSGYGTVGRASMDSVMILRFPKEVERILLP
jgi:hypothetical protein